MSNDVVWKLLWEVVAVNSSEMWWGDDFLDLRYFLINFYCLEVSKILFILLQCQNCIDSQNTHKMSQVPLGNILCDRLSDSQS